MQRDVFWRCLKLSLNIFVQYAMKKGGSLYYGVTKHVFICICMHLLAYMIIHASTSQNRCVATSLPTRLFLDPFQKDPAETWLEISLITCPLSTQYPTICNASNLKVQHGNTSCPLLVGQNKRRSRISAGNKSCTCDHLFDKWVIGDYQSAMSTPDETKPWFIN